MKWIKSRHQDDQMPEWEEYRLRQGRTTLITVWRADRSSPWCFTLDALDPDAHGRQSTLDLAGVKLHAWDALCQEANHELAKLTNLHHDLTTQGDPP